MAAAEGEMIERNVQAPASWCHQFETLARPQEHVFEATLPKEELAVTEALH